MEIKHTTRRPVGRPATRPDPAPPVRSVVRSLRLLTALAERRTATLVELAQATELTPSTAHRLLAALIAEGYVTRDAPSGRLRVGHRALALARIATDELDPLRQAARPVLRQVRDELDETTNLVALDGRMIVYVDQFESTRPVRMFSRIGNRVPAHASGAGKAMLAHLRSDELDAWLRAEPLPRLTTRTIVDPDRLRAELADSRTRGYALDREECHEGVICVAAVILAADGTPQGAVSISGPAQRMERADLAAAGERLRDAARAVADALGP